MLDNAALKDLLGRTAEACGAKGSAEKVDGTPWAEPTPCVRLMGWDRATMRYQRRRPDDAALRQRLCELAAQRRRFDYRRLGWLLAREGSQAQPQGANRVSRFSLFPSFGNKGAAPFFGTT
jgi:hypothetical protein